MTVRKFTYRHPWLFSLLVLLLFIGVQAAGTVIALQLGLPLKTLGIYTGIGMSFLLVILVSTIRWWNQIGFQMPHRATELALYLPALALPLGNLTFALSALSPAILANAALLAATSAFVEEVIFRGLLIQAFLPRGRWQAIALSTLLFGLVHSLNVLAGYDPIYAVIQIGYALAIGFGFGAMAVTGRLLWPLIIAHGLGNFIAFINQGEIGPQLYLVSSLYILLFTSYGLYLMRRQPGLLLDQSASLRAQRG